MAPGLWLFHSIYVKTRESVTLWRLLLSAQHRDFERHLERDPLILFKVLLFDIELLT